MSKLHLYHISQDDVRGYDTYDSAVVVAENPEDAKRIHPSEWRDGEEWFQRTPDEAWYADWTINPDKVEVEYLGPCYALHYRAGDVVCSSFNAG
jgi:hypothetical protein